VGKYSGQGDAAQRVIKLQFCRMSKSRGLMHGNMIIIDTVFYTEDLLRE
jgi:hypothetical protein